MLLNVEYKYSLNNPTIEQVLEELNKIDGVDYTVMILDDKNGDYIQLGGGNDGMFTVEVRLYSSSDKFMHWKAQRLDTTDSSIHYINILGNNVKIKQSEAIDKDTAGKLFKSFMFDKELSDDANWDDITAMFM